MEGWNALSMSIGLLYVVPVIGFLTTWDLFHIRVAVALVSTLFFGEAIKHFVIGKASPRPPGARDCNLWCNDGARGGEPGMPSTHTSNVVLFSVLYGSYTENPWIRAGLVMYAVLMMMSRYQKQCHTLSQILAGAALGGGVGWCVRYRA